MLQYCVLAFVRFLLVNAIGCCAELLGVLSFENHIPSLTCRGPALHPKSYASVSR